MIFDFTRCTTDGPRHDWIDITPIGSEHRIELCQRCNAQRRLPLEIVISRDAGEPQNPPLIFNSNTGLQPPPDLGEAPSSAWPNDLEQLRAATDELGQKLRPAIEPLVLPILHWLDRQIRRSPRLYRWLSR